MHLRLRLVKPFDGKLLEKIVSNPLLLQCNSPITLKKLYIYS